MIVDETKILTISFEELKKFLCEKLDLDISKTSIDLDERVLQNMIGDYKITVGVKLLIKN